MTTRDISQARQRQGFHPSQSRGLFVGVNAFEDQDIGPLSFAVDDAIDLAFLFSCELELVPPNRVHLALSGVPQKPATADQLEWLQAAGAQTVEARANNLHRLAFDLGADTGQDGLWIVTFSTHGFSDQGQDYLAASDSWLLRLAKTGIHVPSLLDDIARAVTPRRLLLLDACRRRLTRGTRGGDGEGTSDSFVQAISNATGLAVLNSTTLGGYSYEDQSLGNGVFTSAMIRGIRQGLKDDGRGFVTVGSLARYLNEEVQAWIKTKRPNDVEVSRGVVYTIEGQAGTLPLASMSLDAVRRREYLRLRELALQRLRRNIGKVILGMHFDEIQNLTRPEAPSETAMALLRELETLDGSERSQRAFLYWYERQAQPNWHESFRQGMELLYGLKGKIDTDAAKHCVLDAASASPVGRLWIAWLRTLGRCSFERDPAAASSISRRDFDEIEALARQGNSEAALVLGFAFTDGIACEMDRSRAAGYLQQPAHLGDTIAINALGWLSHGTEESVRLYRNAAERGNALAMHNLAACLEDGTGIKENQAEAAQWYQSAAERGYPPSMNRLGVLHENGQGVPQDYQIAFRWYQQAAEKGDGAAMTNLGWLHSKGLGTPQDGAAAIHWFQRAVATGNTFGMRSLGAFYADGAGVPLDYGKTIDLWRRAADLGDARAMTLLGEIYAMDIGEGPKPEISASWYQRAAETGDLEAIHKLAILYESGQGVAKDTRKAAELYAQSAEHGNVEAMTALARAYHSGSGVPQSFVEAVRWYQAAAERGDVDAMFELGYRNEKGLGVNRDLAAALRWYLRAAEGGQTFAMNNIGFMYENGLGVAKDSNQARSWYQKSAEHGSPYGMYNLGRSLMTGFGIALPSNVKEAREWLTRAHEHGHPAAQEILNELPKEGVTGSVTHFWKKLTS